MGKPSKFSFPMPGRKHAASKESPSRSGVAVGGSSKAQRILGTGGDLNIDSYRSEDELSWKYPGNRSSGMSITVSDSTNSGIESGNNSGWENEGGPRLRGKASSALLGRGTGEDGTISELSNGLSREGSSSTLRSYYDRQKSPLSISQQTSDSSSRDLALRKGLPHVIPRSPLLRVETFDAYVDHGIVGKENIELSQDKLSRKKPARLDFSLLVPKSMRHGERSASLHPSPSSTSTSAPRTPGDLNPDSARRRLVKMLSRESLSSPTPKKTISLEPDPGLMKRASNSSLSQLYDHYEQLPVRSPRMDKIPESNAPETVPGVKKTARRINPEPQDLFKDDDSFQSPTDKGAWRNNGWSHSVSSPLAEEASSATSVSSRNTKTSRHTSASAMSQADLKETSVLSLSSDSEGEEYDVPSMKSPNDQNPNKKALRVLNGAQEASARKEAKRTPEVKVRPVQSVRSPPRKGAMQETPFLTIPELSSTNSRLSGPWSPPALSPRRRDSGSMPPSLRYSSTQFERHSLRTASSIASVRSTRSTHSNSNSNFSAQPTPPLSPTSVEFRQSSEFSSRFMAVTKQEEALLEALRQKKARMRDRIIQEHESAKSASPPRIPMRRSSKYSVGAASIDTCTTEGTGTGVENQRVLLYLDTPGIDGRGSRIETAEPSPDLSDFLSFGSDEESTPRSSWVPLDAQPHPEPSSRSNGRKRSPRADSTLSPRFRGSQSSSGLLSPSLLSPDSNRGFRSPRGELSPVGNQEGLRISAVGGGFVSEVQVALVVKKTGTSKSGVRFVDDGSQQRAGGRRDYLMDEEVGVW